jgi:CheY-like chemotaxis protein/HPt (histidine-containing phosphotransfer) domain-containing protein
MGGITLVRSEAGKGALFYLRVPLPVPESEAAPLPVDLAFAGPLYALVVEAEEFNSAGLVALLRQLRIEAEVAPSAEAALERCRAQAFALFFLDRDLPGMSGLELARELRRQEAGERRAVIIATTGAATEPARAECLDAGMDGFIAKPVTLENLRAALGEWFGRRPGESRGRLPLGRGRPREPWRLDTLRYMANGDDRELARRTRRYVRELDEYLIELQGALDVADFGRLRRGAHRLVAHLGIIEHAALVSAAQEIEESAVNRDRDGANAKWAEVLSLARQVKIRLVADAESAPSE